jgi:O-methyltransferase involved in polyketide biosynthesis
MQNKEQLGYASSHRVRPNLGGVPETLLIPLWARAHEQSHSNPIIIDPAAERIIEALDYDFSQFALKRVNPENFCIRSKVVDRLVSSILERSGPRTVVEFGPGLDTRFERLGSLAKNWVEIDFPEVAALRERFFPAHPSRRLYSGSMLDQHWMDELRGQCDEPPLFIAEGVFYFFGREQVLGFLSRLKAEFPGSSIVFDACSPLYLRLSNRQHPLANSRLEFALSAEATEIPEWDSQMTIQDYVGFGDSPWYDEVMHRFAWWKRFAVRMLRPARHAFMVVHTAFSDGSEL